MSRFDALGAKLMETYLYSEYKKFNYYMEHLGPKEGRCSQSLWPLFEKTSTMRNKGEVLPSNACLNVKLLNPKFTTSYPADMSPRQWGEGT